MFRPLEAQAELATIMLEGRPVQLVAGANLAAALLQEGLNPFRTTPISGTPRQPYCMMGVCFDCLAEIDGVPNQQTCLETVREGLVVNRQLGAAKVTHD